MNLTVIIPSKTASNLAASIPAVRELEPEARIIIVDDSVNWYEFEKLQGSAAMHFKAIAGAQPFVFSRNINKGIREAGDSDVVLLNDDAILKSHGGFSLMQKSARQHAEYGIIGAVTDLTGQPEQRPRVRCCTSCGSSDTRFKYDNMANFRAWGCNKCGEEFGGPNPLREVEHIAFVCVLIPARTRAALEELSIRPYGLTGTPSMLGDGRFTHGFLDERYTGYGSDDLDYCMQVRAAGLKVGVHDGCFVDHGSLQSSYRGLPTAAGNIWPNHRILREKWGMAPNPQDPEYNRLMAEWKVKHP
jgi:GT2 family glycosyltransferase